MLNCTLSNYTEFITNPCNDEVIEFNLKLKDCHTDNFDRIFLKISGVGTAISGNKYVYSTNLNQNIKNIDLNPGEVAKYTIEVKEFIIGMGDAPDFKLRISYHLTITPNGDVAIERELLESTCS